MTIEERQHRTRLHTYCMAEKQEAMQRSTSCEIAVHHDSLQAVNAWDELMGQLYKPSPVKPNQFAKTKETALTIVGMISDEDYKAEMTQKIQNLQLQPHQ